MDVGSDSSNTFGDIMSGDAFGSDFYHQEDSHTRSAVLSAIPADALGGYLSCFSGEEEEVIPGGEEDANDADDAKNKHKRSTAGLLRLGSRASHLWFKLGTLAPVLPLDTFFRLEATTVFLGNGGGSAGGIGNLLLAYFDAGGMAAVDKVSPVKFAFKSTIEHLGFYCEVKVRMYRHGSGHAVEFQRRDGDLVLFTRVYQRAASHLKAILSMHEVPFAEVGIADTEMIILPPLELI